MSQTPDILQPTWLTWLLSLHSVSSQTGEGDHYPYHDTQPTGQTCKKSRPVRPAVAGNFHILGEIWENSSFSHQEIFHISPLKSSLREKFLMFLVGKLLSNTPFRKGCGGK